MNIERYLAIVEWARRRYQRGGELVVAIGCYPSRYALIEDLAAERHMGLLRHFPGATLATARALEG